MIRVVKLNPALPHVCRLTLWCCNFLALDAQKRILWKPVCEDLGFHVNMGFQSQFQSQHVGPWICFCVQGVIRKMQVAQRCHEGTIASDWCKLKRLVIVSDSDDGMAESYLVSLHMFISARKKTFQLAGCCCTLSDCVACCQIAIIEVHVRACRASWCDAYRKII